jgi:DNA gyrase/topoisomerase IV subunit B
MTTQMTGAINTLDSDNLDITAQVVRALCLYAIAEFQSGHATTLHVTAEGNSFSVADDGRGHAVDRTVAGAPYLQFIYTQLDYPFGLAEGGPVQLQGIGMSLINVLCSDLSVTVRKPNKTLQLTYQAGRLCDEACVDTMTQSTGTTVAGTVHPQLQQQPTDVDSIERWLQGLLAANPAIKLHFNGKVIHAQPILVQSPAAA